MISPTFDEAYTDAKGFLRGYEDLGYRILRVPPERLPEGYFILSHQKKYFWCKEENASAPFSSRKEAIKAAHQKAWDDLRLPHLAALEKEVEQGWQPCRMVGMLPLNFFVMYRAGVYRWFHAPSGLTGEETRRMWVAQQGTWIYMAKVTGGSK